MQTFFLIGRTEWVIDTLDSTNYSHLYDSVLRGNLSVSGVTWLGNIVPQLVGSLPELGVQWAQLKLPRMSVISGVELTGKLGKCGSCEGAGDVISDSVSNCHPPDN